MVRQLLLVQAGSEGDMHTMMLLLAMAAARPDGGDSFNAQAQLQGLYEEMSQAALQYETADDIDQFHDVLYAPDWVFIDLGGQRHPWSEIREEQIQALKTPPFDWIAQSVEKVSVANGTATVLVNMTTVRHAADGDGQQGKKGGSGTINEKTEFRDVWIATGDGWKFQSRQQISRPSVHAVNSEYEEYLKDYSVGR
jgi:hypothetical protein